MKSNRKWATMSEVASLAKVGTITVSRVIRTPEKVRSETRRRVEAAIRELGYVPDETAGALSSSRSRVVGAVISTLDGAVFASTIDGLTRELRQSGFQLLVASSGYKPMVEADFIATLLGRRPDGLVLTSSEHTPEAADLLKQSGIPVVEIWELPDPPIDSAVGFSNKAAGKAITDFLIGRGCRAIGFVGGQSPDDVRGRLRAEGYAAALAAHNLGPARLAAAPDAETTGPDIGALGFAQLLERWPDTDAVVCVSDSVALGAFCEAKRRGQKVPEDIAITGFGDFELAGARGLGLTTVHIPGAAIGERAAQLIVSGSAQDRGQIIDVGFEIVPRTSA